MAAHRAYGAKIRECKKANLRVADNPTATAERSCLRMPTMCRGRRVDRRGGRRGLPRAVARRPAHARGSTGRGLSMDMDEQAEKCRALSKDMEIMECLPRLH